MTDEDYRPADLTPLERVARSLFLAICVNYEDAETRNHYRDGWRLVEDRLAEARSEPSRFSKTQAVD